MELDHQQCYPQHREDGETEALEIKYIYQLIVVFVKIIININILMIMITSKCFILLLLPSPVSCVWIDNSYQSVTRPLSSLS